jgi:putative ABC transport system permease protein
MRWWNRKERERDLERELRADLELEAAEQQENGLSAEEARYAARRALGNAALVKEEVREMWGWVFLDRLKQDMTYALRGMRRSPGFTATAVLSLALGIGANTAIFSLINAVLLRWLPVHDPQELVQLTMRGSGAEPVQNFAYPVVRALADHREIFSNLCGFSGARFGVGRGDSLESTSGAWVTGAYYATLGLQPVAGRLLTEADDRPGAVPTGVITDSYWQRKLGRNPLAIGRQILVDGKPVTIVGVSPGGFTGANVGETADITLPLGVLPQLQTDREFQLDAGSWWLRVLARPQPGISRAQVKARLAVIWRPMGESAIPASMPASRRRVQQSTLDVTSGGTGYSDLRRQFRQPLLVLMAVVGLLLMIACANVANLLLARAAARQKEIAVRLAIGASRARIVRQLLTESLLLSLLSAALGVLLAWAGSRMLVDLLSSGRLRAIVLDVAPDWRVLGFTAAAASATGILFGLAPAFRGTAISPVGALREKISISRSRLAPLLVTTQVSLTLLLLIGAGLFVSTLRNLHRVDAGFQRNGVLLVNADGWRASYRGARAAAFYEILLQQIEQLPGVRSASYSLITPLGGGSISQQIAVNGQPGGQEILFNSVSRRYFETMATAVVLGREFTRRDDAGAPPVAIVNEAFARRYLSRRYLPKEDPLGQHLTVGSLRKQEFDIVGVVRDSIYESLREAAPPTVYVPLIQRVGIGGFGVVFEVHASGSLAQVAAALRSTLQPALPGVPVEVRTLTGQVDRALVQERLMATLAASFGILGLVLAVVGLYGLLAYTVARRTNEIGIRLALGAMRQEVLWMVIRHALGLLGIGVAIGIPAAWAASRFVSSMLFGLTATDPLTIGAAAAVLIAAGLLAGFLPAWRASQVDPMVALRYE